MAFQVLSALLALLILQAVGAAEDFSYDPCSPLGPSYWEGSCATGEQQSPISIKPSNIQKTNLGGLQKDYTKSHAVLLNAGHEIMVNWTTSPGHLTIDGKVYHLQQCHWHSPSEHELHGKRYPLELHMVHISTASEIAVIGVLYEFRGFSDLFLNKLMNGLNDLKSVNCVDLGYIEPPMIGEEEPYFRYYGSLTTPPCSEPVTWTVMTKVQSVTEEQVKSLRAPVGDKDNARPIQPINGRTVSLSQSC
ncbi:alpha carbonic anhydrase 7-like [Canna indica]|uniref:Carbonic anhydrase n=1 Tax=Canna indica TaxID=4628 RepID=A0AAQ3QHR7_9LILI|nr:alpha carbonic anhydrase 7-like [Canna indica]